MKRSMSMRAVLVAGIAGLVLAGWVEAHFQVVMPDRDIVTAERSRTVNLEMLFTHPMQQGPVMEMGAPRRFGVLVGGEHRDLGSSLKQVLREGKSAYTATYTMRQPGDHVFYLEPAAYWEPAERKMIVHYTKVVVDAFASGEGWDALVGFPVEIEPLVRPIGLWTGNTFRGIVRRNGKPVPFAEIEVEYYNSNNRVAPPADAFITQVIKADASGTFSYTMPRAGWWGFAALVDGQQPMTNPEGDKVEVELGALMWVRTVDMK